MEDTLGDRSDIVRQAQRAAVLILILMEDTLGAIEGASSIHSSAGLNPYSNGRYSRRCSMTRVSASISRS